MCQSETMHQIIDFFSVNNKKEKTNDEITDIKDSNNNNKCVSVTVSLKTVPKKIGKRCYNLTPGWPFCIYRLDACDVKNKHITKDNLHIIININVSMWSIFVLSRKYIDDLKLNEWSWAQPKYEFVQL